MNIINKIIEQQQKKKEKEEYEKISRDIDKVIKELEENALNYKFQKILKGTDIYTFRQRRNSVKFISEEKDIRLGLNLFPKDQESYEKIVKLKLDFINEKQEINNNLIYLKEPDFFTLFKSSISFSIDLKSNDADRIYYILTKSKGHYDTEKDRYLNTFSIDSFYNPNKIYLPKIRFVTNISDYPNFYYPEGEILITKYDIIYKNRIQIFLKEFISTNNIHNAKIIETREKYERITKAKIEQLKAITKYFAIASLYINKTTP